MYISRLACHTFLLIHIVMSRRHWSHDGLWLIWYVLQCAPCVCLFSLSLTSGGIFCTGVCLQLGHAVHLLRAELRPEQVCVVGGCGSHVPVAPRLYLRVLLFFDHARLFLRHYSYRNVSKAYRRMRQRDNSKRVKAIDVLASWVWPIISVSVGVSICVYLMRGSFF